LSDAEKATVKRVPMYMETKVKQVINKYWADDEFPRQNTKAKIACALWSRNVPCVEEWCACLVCEPPQTAARSETDEAIEYETGPYAYRENYDWRRT
jgi:hypothetical protein